MLNNTTEIPYGYCQCGCGNKTNISKQTNNRKGYIKGQPTKYLHNHNRQSASLEKQIEKFWSRVIITANDDLCWEWQAGHTNGKYGTFWFNGQNMRANRVAWMLPDYVIPEGLCICHSCDNPNCCNPKHLFLGTHQDNMDDKVKKGRQSRKRK